MIGTLLIWLYATVTIVILGWAICYLIERVTGYQVDDIGVVWMLGLMGVTVYAQYFSLFGKVGMVANVVLVLGETIVLCYYWQRIKDFFSKRLSDFKLKGNFRYRIVFVLTLLLFGVLFICLTCQKARHADTDLYHAQAIRWIEEYGVVKGLGNLHNRFAYNSSFMCLQALFSGAFLINQSTHVLNGYIAFCLFSYVIYYIWGTKKMSSSFLFQIAILLYIFDAETLGRLSSPNTDTLALLLVLFILMKWCQLWENEERACVPYSILCVIGLFAISVKLSTAMILVLILKPVIELLKAKKWKEISFFIALGLVVIVPFLIRNIIISGYLVYPYSSIDLFDVDWKMAKSVVDYDHKEIMAWAKGLDDYKLSNYTLKQWFPVWWGVQTSFIKIMLVLNLVIIVLYVVRIIKLLKDKILDVNEVLVFGTGLALLCFWFFTAPNIRYGRVFVFIIPCFVFGKILYGYGENKEYLRRGLKVATCIGMLIALLPVVAKHIDEVTLKRPAYYIYRECEEIVWEKTITYVATENCYCGYYYLPATPYKHILEFIEMRGATVKDGFKVKECVKEMTFNNAGRIYVDLYQ